MAALTVFLDNAAASLSSALKLSTSTEGSDISGLTVKISNNTGAFIFDPLGANSISTVAGPVTATNPAPNGSGWILDDTSLEGLEILAGTWVPTSFEVSASSTCTATFTVRVFVRHSDGTYTNILVATSSSTVISSIGTASPIFSGVTTSSPTNFGTGDRLYIDVCPNITTAAARNSTMDVWRGGNEQVQTPGTQLGTVSISLTGTTPNCTVAGSAGTATAQGLALLTAVSPNVIVAGVAGSATNSVNTSNVAAVSNIAVAGKPGTLNTLQTASLVSTAAAVAVAAYPGTASSQSIALSANLIGLAPSCVLQAEAGTLTATRVDNPGLVNSTANGSSYLRSSGAGSGSLQSTNSSNSGLSSSVTRG